MAETAPVYVLLRRSGAVVPWSTTRAEWPGPYLALLEQVIRADVGQSQPEYDPPEKLLLNGKIVVESNLLGLAKAYVKDRDDALMYAERAVANLHVPRWAGEAPGFNPPGIDRWKVEKVRA